MDIPHASHEASTVEKEKKRNDQKPELSVYTDFRVYLRDFFEFKKVTSSSAIRPYSYAAFSAAANIKSPNYLKLIIAGQRNLSDDMIKKFGRALQLNKDELEEFKVLVHYGQAQDPLERNRFLKSLAELRVKQQLKSGEINPETWDRVPSWVSWVLYALADQKGADFDIRSVRKLMKGRASLDEIKKSLTKLLDSGELIQDDSTGEIKKGRQLMQGYEDVPVAMVRKIQAELIYLGLESLFQDAPTEREFGSFTMAMTEEEFEQLKFELRQLRKRWLKDFAVKRSQEKGERVFQLNIQLFPVTVSTPNSET